MKHPRGELGSAARRAVVVLLGLAMLAATAVGAASGAASGTGARPRCFGAASRDPLHPCHNPALDFSVTPSSDDALLTPDSPCTPVRRARPNVCAFGTPRRRASMTFASIGDSHSAHWRGALNVVARANGWHGVQLYETGCPFSMLPTAWPPPHSTQCNRWREDVVAWMDEHPEIGTIFVSEHRVGVIVPRGQSRMDAEVDGYERAWAALPATVKHIVVIRDTPYNRVGSIDCIRGAVRRHQRPGVACELPIGSALRPDPAVVAAQRLGSPRVTYVDLTHYFCGARFCFPVVGGVRVHKDIGHITRLYAETLGPYLRRAIARVLSPDTPQHQGTA